MKKISISKKAYAVMSEAFNSMFKVANTDYFLELVLDMEYHQHNLRSRGKTILMIRENSSKDGKEHGFIVNRDGTYEVETGPFFIPEKFAD